MQAPIDLFARQKQQMEEQAAAGERAYRHNVNRFVEMFLSLGPDCIKIAEGTRFDEQLTEAKGIAAHRWNQLLGMEEQAEREAATLASRPKKRPISSTDDTLPDKFLEKQEQEWQDKSTYLRDSLAALKAEAASERRLLESYITKSRPK
jgi:hypothetical protein